MEANPWFAPVARIQSERGHVVAERGPYALVRHPGYLGAALYDLSLPVLLGSRACVPFSLAGLAVGIVRTIREERFLGTRLAGYREYARRVRWRWLPGIW